MAGKERKKSMFLFKKAETFCLWMFLLREKSNLRKLEVLLMEGDSLVANGDSLDA